MENLVSGQKLTGPEQIFLKRTKYHSQTDSFPFGDCLFY